MLGWYNRFLTPLLPTISNPWLNFKIEFHIFKLPGKWIIIELLNIYFYSPPIREEILDLYQLPSSSSSALSSASYSSIANSGWQCSPPDLNRQLRMAMFHAGPQPPAPDGRVTHRTSTASSGISENMQKICQLERQKECQKICPIEYQKECQNKYQKRCKKEW